MFKQFPTLFCYSLDAWYREEIERKNKELAELERRNAIYKANKHKLDKK